MSSIVKTIRQKLMLKQGELAKELGVCRQMIWAYEKGISLPGFEIAKKLMALALANDIEVNAEDFFIKD
jgi:DNA-binding XRE family transcriptional regulator